MITTAMVQSALSDYTIVKTIPDVHSKSYTAPMLFRLCKEKLSEEYIYIADLNEVLPVWDLYPTCHFICVCDSFPEGSIPASICLLYGNMNAEEIFQLLLNYFIRIQSWKSRLQESVLNGRTYQSLLTIAEEEIRSDMVVMDASFSVLAHTSNAANSIDPIMRELLQKGSHSFEQLEKLRSYGLFESYRKSTDILVNEGGTFTQNATAGHWCSLDGNPLIGIVLAASSKTLSESTKDLFRILVAVIEWNFQLSNRAGNTVLQPYEPLLQELLDGSSLSESVLLEKAKRVSIPYEGYYTLYVLNPFDSNTFLLQRALHYITEIMPEAKAVRRGQEIVVLLYSETESDHPDPLREKSVIRILTQFELLCGVSRLFYNLSELKTAYIQASHAVSYGRLLYEIGERQKAFPFFRQIKGGSDSRYVFYYENVALYQMVEFGLAERKEIFFHSPYVQALKKLQTYDQKKGTSYFSTLYVYLTLERNTTKTASELHIHRTNLIYHLEKIQNRIGLSLDDPTVRLNLMIAFRAMELMD